MKLTIVSQYFETAEQPGLTILSSMADYFSDSNDSVIVITGKYIRIGRSIANDSPGKAKYQIRRIWSGSDRSKNIYVRILSFISFSLSSTWCSFFTRKPDIIYFSSPPILAALPVMLVAKLRGALFVLEVCDLWPESAVALGVIRNRTIISIARWIERVLYRRSDAIVALTKGIANSVREVNPNAKLLVAQCQITAPQKPISLQERSVIRRCMGWTDNRVVIFAGTLGYAQDIESIVSAAKLLSEKQSNILIVAMGSGVAANLIQEAAKLLPNLQWLAPVPKAEAIDIIQSADLGLCTLSNYSLFDGAIPTKLMDYISVNLPSVAPDFKEIREIAAQHSNISLYRSGDAAGLAETVELALSKAGHVPPGKTKLVSSGTRYSRNREIEVFLESLLKEVVY